MPLGFTSLPFTILLFFTFGYLISYLVWFHSVYLNLFHAELLMSCQRSIDASLRGGTTKQSVDFMRDYLRRDRCTKLQIRQCFRAEKHFPLN